MPNDSPYPWRFVSAALGVDLQLDVLGDIRWQRPARSRVAEDPNGGPPTQIRRTTGALATQRGSLVLWFTSDDEDFAGTLATFWEAFQAVGPYEVTDHRDVTRDLEFNLAVEPSLDDQSIGVAITVALLEV